MLNSYNKKYLTYAGFWVRLSAYVIDSVIVFAGLLIVRLLVSGLFSLTEGTFLGGNILFHYTLKDIVLYIFQVMYFILFTFCTGTTPGKKLLNLRVVQADGGKPVFFNVLYRETIGRFLCGLSIGIGYIVAGLDKEKRGIHDMLCDTRVVYARRIKPYPGYPLYQDAAEYSVPPVVSAPPVPRQVTPAVENTGEETARSVPQGNTLRRENIPPYGSVPPQGNPSYGNIPPQEGVPPYGSMASQGHMRPQDYNGPYQAAGPERNDYDPSGGQERNS